MRVERTVCGGGASGACFRPRQDGGFIAHYYTSGHYEGVVIAEGSDEAVASMLLKTGSMGNVRSETLRAFTLDEAKRMIGNAT